MSRHQPNASEEWPQGDGGECPVPRRSFLLGMVGGAAAAAAANLVPTGVATAQGTEYQDDYNKLATEDSTHSIPFYGQHQAGIATPPQTAAAFLSFDVAAGTRRELTDLFRTLTERAVFLTRGTSRVTNPRCSRSPDRRKRLLLVTAAPTLRYSGSSHPRASHNRPRRPAPHRLTANRRRSRLHARSSGASTRNAGGVVRAPDEQRWPSRLPGPPRGARRHPRRARP